MREMCTVLPALCLIDSTFLAIALCFSHVYTIDTTAYHVEKNKKNRHDNVLVSMY